MYSKITWQMQSYLKWVNANYSTGEMVYGIFSDIELQKPGNSVYSFPIKLKYFFETCTQLEFC